MEILGFSLGDVLTAMTVAILGWTARTLLEVTRTQAIHDLKHKHTDDRLSLLERRPTF